MLNRIPVESPQTATAPPDAALRLLQLSARLLLEYNVPLKDIERGIGRIARHVGVDDLQTLVGYREVTLETTDGLASMHGRLRFTSTSPSV